MSTWTYAIPYRRRVIFVFAHWGLVVLMIGMSSILTANGTASKTDDILLLTALTTLAVIRTAELRRVPIRVTASALAIPRTLLPKRPNVIPIDSICRVAWYTGRYGRLYLEIYHPRGLVSLRKHDFSDPNMISWLFDFLSWHIVHRTMEQSREPQTLQSTSAP